MYIFIMWLRLVLYVGMSFYHFIFRSTILFVFLNRSFVIRKRKMMFEVKVRSKFTHIFTNASTYILILQRREFWIRFPITAAQYWKKIISIIKTKFCCYRIFNSRSFVAVLLSFCPKIKRHWNSNTIFIHEK